MPKASFDRFRRQILACCKSSEVSGRLSEIGQFQQAARGQQIALSPAYDQLVFLAEGATKLVVQMPDATEHVLAFHFPGDMIYVPRPDQNGISMLALADCRTIAFPANDFLEIGEAEPSVLRTILSRTMVALQRSRNKAIRLGRKAAQERIADFLLAMADRIGIREGNSIQLTLPMSRRDIGNSLGLTIETVSRQFTELRDDGLISTAGRSIVRLHDIHELAVRAGHAPRSDERSEICAESKNDRQAAAIASVE